MSVSSDESIKRNAMGIFKRLQAHAHDYTEWVNDATGEYCECKICGKRFDINDIPF